MPVFILEDWLSQTKILNISQKQRQREYDSILSWLNHENVAFYKGQQNNLQNALKIRN